ncbi:MAG: hypothetical protein HG422_08615 [Prevotella sp.]|nr:hypothetical protein [Prevotella sp.]
MLPAFFFVYIIFLLCFFRVAAVARVYRGRSTTCMTAVGSVADGRHTHRTTAAVRAADGRRTMNKMM